MRKRTLCATAALWGTLIPVGAGIALVQPAPALAQQAAVASDWVVPERRARARNPVTADAAALAQGRELFLRECRGCHGETGNNDGPDTKTVDMSNARKLWDPSLGELTDGALFWKIGEGRGSMPSTWDILTDRERWLVVIYARSLAPRKDASP